MSRPERVLLLRWLSAGALLFACAIGSLLGLFDGDMRREG